MLLAQSLSLYPSPDHHANSVFALELCSKKQESPSFDQIREYLCLTRRITEPPLPLEDDHQPAFENCTPYPAGNGLHRWFCFCCFSLRPAYSALIPAYSTVVMPCHEHEGESCAQSHADHIFQDEIQWQSGVSIVRESLEDDGEERCEEG
jgi:hypothetical protein